MNTPRFHNLKQRISRKHRPLLVLLLLLVFWTYPAPIGIAVCTCKIASTYQFGWYTALDPKCLRDVAVVTSVNKIGNRWLQQAVVEELAESLVYTKPAKDAAGHPLSCKVTVYDDLDRAISAKPSLYLIVRAPELSYLPVFMWKAIIQVDGATTPDRAHILLNPDIETRFFNRTTGNDIKEAISNSRSGAFFDNGEPRPRRGSARHVKEKILTIKHEKGKPEYRSIDDAIFISTTLTGKGFCVMNSSYLVSYISDTEVNKATKMLWSGVYGRELRN